jgi:UDP-2,4-diacetamido-2,4,6-trideoxy-beta-L-altropyranose hydrolase
MRQSLITFRTNGGASIGLGHVRRCLTLAQVLHKRGAEVRFVVNNDPQVAAYLQKYGVESVPVDDADVRDLRETRDYVKRWEAQALVVDSYAVLGECLADSGAPFVVVIDDMADRPFSVDLVVNGAVHARELAYQVLPKTRLLLGPDYVLLREEFAQEPTRQMRERVERVLITVGGMDPVALTPRLMAWAREALGKVNIDVVVGPFFTKESLRQAEQQGNGDDLIAVHHDPPHIRELMLACDVALAGGGQTTYELAATGTPTVAMMLAGNQTGSLSSLSTKDALLWVGHAHDGDLHEKVVRALASLSARPDVRRAMSRSGRLLVDGRGTVRVGQAIMEACEE